MTSHAGGGVCDISFREPTSFSSYALPLRRRRFPAALLCDIMKEPAVTYHRNRRAQMQVLVLKTARSGSHMLVAMLEQVARASHGTENVTVYWEPFNQRDCFHMHPGDMEEKAFSIMLSGCVVPGPADLCHPTPGIGTNGWASQRRSCSRYTKVTITATNPRFTDQVRWGAVTTQQTLRSSVIINLRRTNIVRLAYSKLHHGGCRTLQATLNESVFTLEVLLVCAWHFGIGDQEHASSVAVEVARATGGPLQLVLYEDQLSDEAHVERTLSGLVGPVSGFSFEQWKTARGAGETGSPGKVKSIIGSAIPANNLAETQRVHAASSLCEYPDVPCRENMLPGLDGYPCLAKQFAEGPAAAWTLPMLHGSVIDLRGDCTALPRLLSRPHGVHTAQRRLSELYTSRARAQHRLQDGPGSTTHHK